MKTKLIRIGNSQGIRIPKPLLQQCGLEDMVDITVEDNRLVITRAVPHRQGWDKAFQAMAKANDDRLLISDAIEHSWDSSDEWQWE